MSRRDTIIVAILVNAGLLMILFATALRSDRSEKKEFIAVAPQPEKPQQEVLIDQYLTEQASHHTEEIACVPSDSQLVVSPALPEKTNEAEIGTEFFDIVVKKGDILDKLAKDHQTTVAYLMQCNHLASTQLKIGQVLRIPGSKAVKHADKTPPRSTESGHEAAEYYIIREGDNPWLIASKNHLKLDDLLRLNSLDEQKARKLRPGDRLKIR